MNKDITKEALEHILAHMPGHVYWKDKQGVYLACNNAQARSLGFKYGYEVVGKTDFDISQDKESAKAFRANDLEVMQSGEIKIIEEQTIVDGKLSIVLSQKVPFRDSSGEITGILGISTDITELKKMQKELAEQIKIAQQADLNKTLFVTIASHEIKGPLANTLDILGRVKIFLESLKEEIFDNELYDLVVENIADAQKGKDALDNLIRFINLDPKKYNNQSDIVIKEFFEDLINKHRYNEKNISFTLDIKDNVPSKIKLDAFCLKEISDILIDNAIKFNKVDGLINISASLVQESNNRKFMELVFEDSGIGIAGGALKNFFKPLLSESNDEPEKRYVTPAIKLSFVKKLTESLGGKFEIASNVGKGTKIIILTPIEYASEQKINIRSNLIRKNLRILVVEDNLLTLKLMKSKLSKLLMKVDVDTASRGSEAENLANKKKYTVIFLDISLPDIDGVELKERLSRTLGEDVFFIAVTSHSSEKDREYFINTVGFTDVLGKPVSEDELESCVNTIINAYSDNDY